MRPARSRARPQVDVLERPPARPEPPQPDFEVGDGVANGVVARRRRRRRGAARRRRRSRRSRAPVRIDASSSARPSTSTTSPAGPRRTSASVPACTTSPPSTITTASQILSTSSRWWDDTMMCMPNSLPMRRIRSSISVRCIGSSPSVGSSRRTSSGSCAIAEASFTRCRWPVDIVPTGRKRSSPRPTSQSASLARCTAARRGNRCISARCRTRSCRRQLRRQVVVLRRVADARPQLEPGRRGIVSEHGQLAGVPGAQPEQDRDERRLAGAVRAEQAGDPGADLGVETRERDRLSVALHDPSRRDDDRRIGLLKLTHTHLRYVPRAEKVAAPPRRVRLSLP